MSLREKLLLWMVVSVLGTSVLADNGAVPQPDIPFHEKTAEKAGKLSAPPEIMVANARKLSSVRAPSKVHELLRSSATPFEKLGSARTHAIEKLRKLQEWNRAENIPVQNGFARSIINPVSVSLGPEARRLSGRGSSKAMHRGQISQSEEDEFYWTTSIDVEDAYQLRLHLQADSFPDDVQMWVYGENDDLIGPFGPELLDSDGGLWTPSVSGTRIGLVVRLSASEQGVHFNIDQVAELFQLSASGEPVFEAQALPSCLVDSQCISTSTYPFIEETEASVAIIRYMENGTGKQCTAGLVADTDWSSQIPYLLTANHCLNTQVSASSLEAFWDYKRNACNGSAPNLYTVPRSNGSTLLATGTSGDYTLLRLNSVPPGRWFMGWDANPQSISPGTILHRVSYPGGQPQSYSQSRVNQFASCRASYIHQTPIMGSLTFGSSGTPVFLGNGKIVGQNYGFCGSTNSCAYASHTTVDGAFHTYWSAVKPYLNPPAPPAPEGATYFVPIEPCRIIDTRNVGGTFGNGTTRHYRAWGTGLDTLQGGAFDCGIPNTASAVEISFTAIGPSSAGFLRAWPYNLSEPHATLLNFNPVLNVSNSSALAICSNCASDISIKIYYGPTHLAVEVLGYYELVSP